MGHTSTMITANGGVNFDDISAVLGLSTGVLKELCLADNINPWAKYKPVAAAAIAMIQRTDTASLGLGNAARTTLGPPWATTVQALINLYADGDSNTIGSARANGWRYWKPRGRSYSEWYRALDFVKIVSVNGELQPALNSGYEHSARNPFGTFTCKQSVSRIGGTVTAQNNVIIPTTGLPDENIVIEDINAHLSGALKMLYYGILLVPQTGSGPCGLIFNNEATISAANTGDDYVRGKEDLSLVPYVLNGGIALGTYNVYPFLTNMKISELTRFITVSSRTSSITSDVPRLYPLPGATPQSMVIYDTLVIIEVYASTASTLLTTDIYITVTNNGDSAITISSLVLKWRTGTGSFTDTRKTGEVFYDGTYRYDDDYPSGTSDSRYSALLTPSTPYTIPAGTTVRIPEDGLWMAATVPNREANVLFIGRPDQPTQYGSTTVRLPAET